MSDALPLPPHPSLEHYKKRAKDLVKICKSGDRDALRAWATEWIEALVKLYDLDITLPRDGHRAYTPAEISYRIERTVDRVAKHLNKAVSRRVALAPLPRRSLPSPVNTVSQAGPSLPFMWKDWRGLIRRCRHSKPQLTPSSAATCRHSKSCLARIPN
jgi:hypothetical protein